MCLLYLVAIIIIFLLLWKLMSKNNVAPQKSIESFQENTVTFTKPQNMFLKAMREFADLDSIKIR